MPFDAAAFARKLKLSPATSPVVLDASPDDLAALSSARRDLATSTNGTHDWILLYVENRAALEAALPAASAALASPGTLWIAYPKGSSKRQTDLTRDPGLGLAQRRRPDVAVAGVDRRDVVRVRAPSLQAGRGAPDLPLMRDPCT